MNDSERKSRLVECVELIFVVSLLFVLFFLLQTHAALFLNNSFLLPRRSRNGRLDVG